MNITIPRSIQTKIELEELAGIKKHLINVQTSLPLVGCKIDAITGVYILTSREGLMIPKETVLNILSGLEEPIDKPFPKIPKEGLSGKEFFSCIIPMRVNVDDRKILIKNGELISGVLTKAYLSEGQANNLIQLIFELYDEDEARKFFDNAQRIIDQFNLRYSFTTTFSDITYPDEVRTLINAKIMSVIEQVNRYTTEMENNPTLSTPEVFENAVIGYLSNIRSEVGAMVISRFNDDNNITIIKNSGSSGKVNPDSISKNIISEAQHVLRGSRIMKMDGRRTLPYFCRDLDTPMERGFNVNGFLSGLRYPEFVYNNMTGREGLINNQLKTAESGYIQRKLTKTMEDFTTAYDGTVRDISQGIVQFSYGDSNVNPSYQHRYVLKSLTEDFETIQKKYLFSEDDLKKIKGYSNYDNDQFRNEFVDLKKTLTLSTLNFRRNIKNFDGSTMFLLPININKLKSIILQHQKKTTGEIVSASHVIDSIHNFFNHSETFLLPIDHDQSKLKIEDEQVIKTALKLAIFEVFAPRRCVLEYQLSKEAFDDIMDQLVAGYEHSLIEPGEMVGLVAGQSICQNITQANLRSHHLTGVVSKTGANAGVSRIQEIFNVSKDIKTPIMTIVLKQADDKKLAEKLAAYLQVSRFGELVDKTTVAYSPVETTPENKGLVAFGLPKKAGEAEAIAKSCKWIATFYLNKEELLFKNITTLDILVQLSLNWKSMMENKKTKDVDPVSNCLFYSTMDNSEVPLIQIRFGIKPKSYNGIYHFINNVCEMIRIQGIDNIAAAEVDKEPVYNYNEEIGKVEKSERYVIQTAGINHDKLLEFRDFDVEKSFINDIQSILKIYGVEAVRAAIIDEMLTLVNDQVNYNHLSVLIDYMTRNGNIIPINRNGLKKSNASLISKITFEQQVAQLINSAVENESDNIVGVSSRIMTGRVPHCGTGMCDVAMDVNFIVNSEIVDQPEEEVYAEQTINDIAEEFDTVGFTPF